MNLDGSTVLLTGASEGIGLEIARLLGPRAQQVVLVARSRERLEAVAEEMACETRVIPMDLAERGCVDALLEQVADLEIDVLINNAGFSQAGPFRDQGPELVQRMLELNAVTPTLLMNRLVPAMCERGRGAVLNVGSVAGVQPVPLMMVYSAAKAYLNNASEALTSELTGTGVSVTCLAPGSTYTGFHEKAGMPVEKAAFAAEKPQAVARKGLRALEKQKRLYVSGVGNKVTVFLQRFAPRALVVFVAKKIFQTILK